MRMQPELGSVKPPIIRRQVVLPEPEGPSRVKNSPAAIARSTRSTARTCREPAPKTQLSASRLTAAVIRRAPRVERRAAPSRLAIPSGDRPTYSSDEGWSSTTTQDGDVVADPLVIRHALVLLGRALGGRRLPERDLLEGAQALALAAFVAEQLVALAGVQHHRHRAEPGRQVAL